MITVSYTGAILILCIVLVGVGAALFWYIRKEMNIVKSMVANTKEQNMVDARGLADIIKLQSRHNSET